MSVGRAAHYRSVVAGGALALGSVGTPLYGQSPRAANPERPTFATHAYAVAPGYIEIEQGLREQGVDHLSEQTAWDVNAKVGIAPWVQLALFGPPLVRTAAGSGVGDLGLTLKLRTDVSRRAAVAFVSSLTFATGDAEQGRGAGRTLGAALAVASVDLLGHLHLDLNVGPTGLGSGAGTAQWFHSASATWTIGRWGLTSELYGFTAAAGEPAQWGVLAGGSIRVIDWAVVDAGGSVGVSRGTPDLLFVGLTTNLGQIF